MAPSDVRACADKMRVQQRARTHAGDGWLPQGGCPGEPAYWGGAVGALPRSERRATQPAAALHAQGLLLLRCGPGLLRGCAAAAAAGRAEVC